MRAGERAFARVLARVSLAALWLTPALVVCARRASLTASLAGLVAEEDRDSPDEGVGAWPRDASQRARFFPCPP